MAVDMSSMHCKYYVQKKVSYKKRSQQPNDSLYGEKAFFRKIQIQTLLQIFF